MGVIVFDAPGATPPFYTHDGTTSRQDFTRWLVQQPGGVAEIEILTSKGWINCVTGELNVELVIQDEALRPVLAACSTIESSRLPSQAPQPTPHDGPLGNGRPVLFGAIALW